MVDRRTSSMFLRVILRSDQFSSKYMISVTYDTVIHLSDAVNILKLRHISTLQAISVMPVAYCSAVLFGRRNPSCRRHPDRSVCAGNRHELGTVVFHCLPDIALGKSGINRRGFLAGVV
jgi:hypothetical protein